MLHVIGAILLLPGAVEPAQQLRYTLVAREYVEESGEDAAIAGSPVPIPANIEIAAGHEAIVHAMLQRSQTFRAQCSRLAAGGAHVVVQRTLQAPVNTAVTRIVRDGFGRIEADVEVGIGGDPVVLIAHEFEHIIEQLDGVDLPALAARPGTGVEVDPILGRFETERAIAAGRRVANEVSRAGAGR